MKSDLHALALALGCSLIASVVVRAAVLSAEPERETTAMVLGFLASFLVTLGMLGIRVKR